MKIINLTLIFFFTIATLLHAQESNNSEEDLEVITVRTLELKKSKKSSYDRFEELFSDYDGTWMEDMFIYSIDVFMPDEFMRATKDVIKNRRDEGHSSQSEVYPKSLGNDAYNMFLTSMYYYIQDVYQITGQVWSDEVCTPDTFVYDEDKEPKKVFLNLKASDKNARGVTEKGVVLPINHNFPNAYYPYAKRPDGCTTDGLEDLYKQSNEISDDDAWITEACNEHDRCYSTLGTTSQECNSQFIVRAIDACNEISAKKTVLSAGSKNAFCGFKGFVIATGANYCAKKYFNKAQRQQKLYMEWVEKYEKAYLEAMSKR
jgi:hypothetical protein